MEHIEWLAKVSDNPVEKLSINEIATKAGVTQSTLNRRAKLNELTADLALQVAHAYRYDPIQALVDLGFITTEDMKKARHRKAVKASLADATDQQIVAEVARRVAGNGAKGSLSEPLRFEGFPGS